MQAASKKIEALLTVKQKALVPSVLKDASSLRSVGIPLDTYGELKLTDTQKSKLAEIAQKTQATMRSAFQKAQQSGDFQSIRETMQQSRETTRSAVEKVLTESQNKVVETFMKSRMRQGQGEGAPPPPPGE